ncbi:MAG: hypothetical protein JWL97_3287 [Gemmatimonadales bacterium]|jgi:hypothetical protein|nr:hypothetical protein [Gemmatimonadales bacterium]
MYSTCLFCHASLGANEAIEHFPIGRRLAFDAAKGRLWVVCRKCERWNLTPIEERWEAIEECERSYLATRLRVSTDQIGLARIAEGLELVRIGQPQRPEFAAWRYGDQFGRRRRKRIIQGAAIATGVATVPFIGVALGLSLGGVGGLIFNFANVSLTQYVQRRTVARVHDSEGNLLRVRAFDAHGTAILEPTATESWGLRLMHVPVGARLSWNYRGNQDHTDFRGERAMRVAAQLLPRLNATGASSRQIKDAVFLATEHETPSITFEQTARLAATKPTWKDYGKGALLGLVPAEVRLALEMAAHEESERRALEGELYLLEDAWKEAEEIAAISDDLFLPEAISTRLAEMKRR